MQTADTNWGGDPDEVATTCPAWRWCQEAPGHRGRHRRELTEIRPDRIEMDCSVSVSVYAGADDGGPHAVLGVGFTDRPRFGSCRLTWTQVERLEKALASARRRYGR